MLSHSTSISSFWQCDNSQFFWRCDRYWKKIFLAIWQPLIFLAMCLFGDVTGVLFWRRDPSPPRPWDPGKHFSNLFSWCFFFRIEKHFHSNATDMFRWRYFRTVQRGMRSRQRTFFEMSSPEYWPMNVRAHIYRAQKTRGANCATLGAEKKTNWDILLAAKKKSEMPPCSRRETRWGGGLKIGHRHIWRRNLRNLAMCVWRKFLRDLGLFERAGCLETFRPIFFVVPTLGIDTLPLQMQTVGFCGLSHKAAAADTLQFAANISTGEKANIAPLQSTVRMGGKGGYHSNERDKNWVVLGVQYIKENKDILTLFFCRFF